MIDTAERIFAAFDIIDELTKEQGLVTSETYPRCERLQVIRRAQTGCRG